MTTDPLAGFLARESALVATIGFHSGNGPANALAAVEARPEVIDLDDLDVGVRPSGEYRRLAVVARTMTDLHRAVAVSGLLPQVRQCLVVITEMAAVNRPVQVRLPAYWTAQSLLKLEVRFDDPHRWSCEFAVRQPLAAVHYVRAVIATTTESPRPMSPRFALHGPGSGHWSPGAPTSPRPPLPVENSPNVPFYDVMLHTGPLEKVSGDDRVRFLEVRDPRPVRRGIFGGSGDPVHDSVDPGILPPIDEFTVNRMGFDNRPKESDADLVFADHAWQVRFKDGRRMRLDPSGAVTDFDLERLRELRSVRVHWDGHPGSIGGLRTVAGLACGGVPLVSRDRSPLWAGALNGTVTSRMDMYASEELSDALRRESHSVALSRAALREHSSAAHTQRVRAASGLPPEEAPSVSVLLCTMRPDFLVPAIRQISAQDHPRIEIVLVLHGLAADVPEVKQAIADCPLPITVVEVDGDEIFGGALNLGAQAASGEFITKFDDDDWYSPHHVSDLVRASHYSGAVLVGCGAELVYLEEFDLTVQRFGGHSERRSLHVAGGTILIRLSTFRELGGYRRVRTAEDRELLAAVAEAGGTIYRMHGIGYVLARRASGHTWNRPSAAFLRGTERQMRGVNLGDFVTAGNLEAAL
ncbi:glycosyltransferase [Glycomyces xiaoerkulensis]|uniref:glycosyltransferase n=1 Tax=Glycomyces xiaoerkulensis TaxID=2038139 RepID=UPI000C25743D|nr:glycosyltransferase [Glycomyces xiaoerkulensis]